MNTTEKTVRLKLQSVSKDINDNTQYHDLMTLSHTENHKIEGWEKLLQIKVPDAAWPDGPYYSIEQLKYIIKTLQNFVDTGNLEGEE